MNDDMTASVRKCQADHQALMNALWKELLPERETITEMARQSSDERVPRERPSALVSRPVLAHRVMAAAADAVYGAAMDSVMSPSLLVPERWLVLLPLLNPMMTVVREGAAEFRPPLWLMALAASASVLELKARFPGAFK